MTGFNTTGDAKSIFDYAERFFETIDFLHKKGTPSEVHRLIWPIMTLAAFASELYLKCLVGIEKGTAPKGHDLYALFESLSPQTQRRVERHWDQIAKRRSENLDAIEQQLGRALPRDLRSNLKAGARGFELLRYAYEVGNSGFAFSLSDLPVALRRAILEMRLGWGSPDTSGL